MKKNQIIDCVVYGCRYCDCDHDLCTLKKIKVCNSRHQDDKESTMCDSYEEKKE